jgi:hypothetical protein
MTLEQAKHILATYQLPLSPNQIAQYKIALQLVASNGLKTP